MHPVLFTWGPVEVHSYGVTLFLAIATAYFLVRAEAMRRGQSSAFARHLSIAALIGGWLGSKLWYLAEHRDAFAANPLGELFAGSGQVFLGALAGGAGALLLFLRLRRRSTVDFMDIILPAVMAANGIGRLGCMLSGDGDYGVPSQLPFPLAVDMSGGLVPPHRHPGLEGLPVTAETTVLNTPLIEFAVLLGLALWLHGRHRHSPPRGWVLGLTLLCMGLERFVIEFWRLNPDRLGPLSDPQLAGLLIGLAGIVVFAPREIERRCRAH